jgi:hypothetical protein
MATFIAMTGTTAAPGARLPRIGFALDFIAAFAAYALHRLRKAHVGAVIRVRRSSDNTELDIGLVDNELDVDALLTFCGAGSGYIVAFYDQTGNGRTLSSAGIIANGYTLAVQPRIVNAGVLETIRDRPCIRALGGQLLAAVGPGADFMAMGGQTSIALVEAPGQGGTVRLLAATSSGGTNPHHDPLGMSGGSLYWQYQSIDVNHTLGLAGVGTSTPHVITTVDTGTSVKARLDGEDGTALANYARQNTGSAFNRLCLFGQWRGGTAGQSMSGNITAKLGALVILPPAVDADDYEHIEAGFLARTIG